MNDDEFVAGYMDGRDPDSPEPSENRSHRYQHSFAIGRAEISKGALPAAATLREYAREAEAKDASL